MADFIVHRGTLESMTSSISQVGDKDITLYVRTTGDDGTGDGSSTNPFKTMTHALNTLPDINFGNNWVVDVGAGTFGSTGSTYCPNFYFKNNGPVIGSLIVRSSGWVNFTPATGPGSGTFTGAGADGWNVTLSGAGWTSGDLKGKFLYITSGSWNDTYVGKYLPIYDNTSDTIHTSVHNASNMLILAPASFQIVEPGTLIENDIVGGIDMDRYDAGSLFDDSSIEYASSQIKFVGFKFSVSPSYIDIVSNGTACAFESCHMLNISKTISNSGSILLKHCYVDCFSGFNIVSTNSNTRIIGTVITDTAVTPTTSTAIIVQGGSCAINSCVISNNNAGTGALAFKNVKNARIDTGLISSLPPTVFNSKIVDCNTAISIYGGCSTVLSGVTIDNVSVGLKFVSSGNNDVALDAVTINVADNGIYVLTGNNSVTCDHSCEISNCTSYGVHIGHGYQSCCNLFAYIALTMSSNTKDFTTDGGITDFTMADVYAETDKRISDFSNFNIVSTQA